MNCFERVSDVGESWVGGGGGCGLIFGLGVGIKVRSGSHCEDGSQARGN